MSHGDRPGHDRSPWGIVAVVASLGFLVGGILWPGIAESFLRVLLASLALGWAAARALEIGLPAAMLHETYSPFDGLARDLPSPTIPDVVRRRARALTAVDDADHGGLRPIPWPVQQDLADEAARRLEKGHGLRVNRPADAVRIRPLVSEITWTLLGIGDSVRTPEAADAEARAVPLARLDDILDDLERL